MGDFALKILLSSAGTAVVGMLLARIIPSKKVLRPVAVKCGNACAAFGRLQGGKHAWRLIRNIIFDSVGVLWEGWSYGASQEKVNGDLIYPDDPRHSLHKK